MTLRVILFFNYEYPWIEARPIWRMNPSPPPLCRAELSIVPEQFKTAIDPDTGHRYAARS